MPLLVHPYSRQDTFGHNDVVTEHEPRKIKPGDIYEDCSFHPVLCTFNDGDQIQGISLIDATAPRACSISHCAVTKLSVADVITARTDWPAYLARRKVESSSRLRVVHSSNRGLAGGRSEHPLLPLTVRSERCALGFRLS
jgi:hypothetical protein